VVQTETRIMSLEQDKPSWDAPGIREKLVSAFIRISMPAINTNGRHRKADPRLLDSVHDVTVLQG
jgi:hypothetical protein